MIKNGCEVKEWFLRVNYNSKIFNFAKEFLNNFYFISANISEDIKNLFLEKIGNDNLEYAGSVLQVSEKDGLTQSYDLNAYFIGKAEYNGYLVGFLSAELLNVTIDWFKYTKSDDYINIDIPTEDVSIINQITQGFKNKKIYSNTRVTINDDNSVFGMTEILNEKKKVRNFTTIFENKIYLDEPSTFKYFYISMTPSINLLATSICKLSESYKSKGIKNIKSIENKNKVNLLNNKLHL